MNVVTHLEIGKDDPRLSDPDWLAGQAGGPHAHYRGEFSTWGCSGGDVVRVPLSWLGSKLAAAVKTRIEARQ